MVYIFLDKNTLRGAVKSDIISNQPSLDLATWKLSKELHGSIIRKFGKRKVHLSFVDNIWRADLADMH